MMDKKQLEIKLSSLEGFQNPDPRYEQYQTPSGITALITHHAYMQGNVKGKTVYDLGCGTGMFAIAAKLLGADQVVGVDLDREAIETARKNADKLGVEIEWVEMNVKELTASADTVLQNPPFGAQVKGSDRVFIKKALETAPTTYSLHNEGTNEFIERYVKQQGGVVAEKTVLSFPIRRTFNFHKKKEKPVKVNLYKFIRDS
ncbi:METTL5 family protein [Methanonatronarchaeum sp. AMET6-2]|uniref:METTL5 family protein n=1 Tax=Methanonatronarchaeum sp. AMET6-2 TaxID=2933293 RepID=UPI00121C7ACE|nr:METTL5 family protein [Methanonatronarchaeum sp. AMET6-2]RZN62106.1 MAG: methyltransferase domain-containing protein [Methanonatronarchaeia archaeon]UOY10203.1 METTL5 family protein [Methanonatronarchaeum sp. AMET6-2]